MSVFLDWASTSPEIKYSAKDYGEHMNPNATYAHNERKTLLNCEERIIRAIGANDGHILYFRTATDAITWLHNQTEDLFWSHSPYEHDCCEYGDATKAEEAHGDFYIHQLVNHVTGTWFNIPVIRSKLDNYTMLVVDATAAIGKTPLDDVCDICQAMFMSGHKIGCPDLSFMWVCNDLFKMLRGGNDIRNQWDLVHGSLPVGAVMALTDAVEDVCGNAADHDMYVCELATYLLTKLEELHIEYEVIGDNLPGVHSIYAIRLNGLNADALQSWLASKGVYIGIGRSSCAEKRDNRILCKGFGLSEEEADEVVRISFGENSSESDIAKLVEKIFNFTKIYA